jgi:hypothetical protein
MAKSPAQKAGDSLIAEGFIYVKESEDDGYFRLPETCAGCGSPVNVMGKDMYGFSHPGWRCEVFLRQEGK